MSSWRESSWQSTLCWLPCMPGSSRPSLSATPARKEKLPTRGSWAFLPSRKEMGGWGSSRGGRNLSLGWFSAQVNPEQSRSFVALGIHLRPVLLVEHGLAEGLEVTAGPAPLHGHFRVGL